MNTQKHADGYFQTHDSVSCYYQCWFSEKGNQKNLVIHHGMGEHSERHSELAEFFTKNGINVFSFDCRGHGKSEGTRGDSKGIRELSLDLGKFLDFLQEKYQIEKPILLGHSMGGLIALDYSLLHSNQLNLKALVVNAAALRPIINFQQKIKIAVGRFLYTFAPRLVLHSGLPTDALSRHKDSTKAYQKDPLTHGKLSIRLGLSIIDSGQDLLQKAKNLKIPVLVSHGEQDRIADPTASKELYENISSNDKTLAIYPELYHETYHELPESREKVIKDLYEWVKSHL